MAFVTSVVTAKMRDIVLVRNLACCRAYRDLSLFIPQLSKQNGCCPRTHCLASNISCSTHASQLLKKRDQPVFVSSQAWQSNQSKKPRYILHDTEEEVRILAHTHSDIGWGVRLAAENGYLSWMRNTYIMTLAGIAMINSDVASISSVAGGGAFLVAGLNMLVGSAGFIYNLYRLKKEEHMSGSWALICQFLIVLHLILWCSILLVFLPDMEKATVALEEELKHAEHKDS